MRSNVLLLTGLLALTTIRPAPARQGPVAAPEQPPAPAAPPTVEVPPADRPAGGRALTREDVEAWLDGFLPFAIARGDVAGAVVVVVKDGEVLLQKGYGYADVAARKPVDPATTMFRPGSVSKLFTWTAVMQQVEQGRLDLDADVSGYLDYPLRPREGPPVTLRHLLTHTPGFDEFVRGLIVTNARDFSPLEQSLKSWVPPRVTEAGSTTAYSNYGAALAGYIVQRVSGQSFDDYVDARILGPLGMSHSTFRQPLPANLEGHMAKGYELGSGEPKPFELIGLAPAGSLSASGADMARFMIAHLQKGAFGGTRILEEATAVEMHDTAAATAIPPLHSMKLGFYQADTNGHRVIAHGGDTQWFHSDLNLFVDDGVGLFLSVNSLGREGAAGPIRTALLSEFSDRYFPAAPEKAAPDAAIDPETAAEHAALLAGRWNVSRRSHTTFTAALNLLSQLQVGVAEDGAVVIGELKDLNDQPKKWREVAPFVWKDAGGDRIAAQVEDGRIVRWGYDRYPFMTFEPVPWWSSASWLLPLWVAGLVALLLTTLAWPISALVRRRYGVPYGLTGPDAAAHRRIRLASLCVLLAMVAVVATVTLMFSDFEWLAPGIKSWVLVLRALALFVLVGGAAIGVWNAWSVLRSGRRRLAKVWSVVLAIACLTMLWVGLVFKMAGFGGDF